MLGHLLVGMFVQMDLAVPEEGGGGATCHRAVMDGCLRDYILRGREPDLK